jgi:murein DD-endopeptidase MepM/ murein hydrolase activator NlpD
MPDYRAAARRAAKRWGLDPSVFERQIGAESTFDPSARSNMGAIGIAQIMPATAKGWGVDPTDPIASLNAAAEHMAEYVKQFGSYKNALVAYNAGPGGVGHPLKAETAAYIDKILGGSDPKTLGTPSSSSPKSSSKTTTTTDPGSSYVPGTISQQLAGALGAKAKPQSGGLPLPSFAQGSLVPTTSGAPRKQRFDANAAAQLLQAIGPEPRPASTETTTTKTKKSGAPTGNYIGWPTGEQGKLIGSPHQGTHTLGNWQSDNAVDIGVPEGTPMVALQDGVIVKVKHHPQDGGRFAGDQITVRGANGNEYFYAHGLADVKEGQKIKRGQSLGVTGSANGVAHLHFGQMNGDPRAHTR